VVSGVYLCQTPLLLAIADFILVLVSVAVIITTLWMDIKQLIFHITAKYGAQQLWEKVVVYVYGGDPRLQKQDIENNQSIKRKM
jgi:hypothetical protein